MGVIGKTIGALACSNGLGHTRRLMAIIFSCMTGAHAIQKRQSFGMEVKQPLPDQILLSQMSMTERPCYIF